MHLQTLEIIGFKESVKKSNTWHCKIKVNISINRTFYDNISFTQVLR